MHLKHVWTEWQMIIQLVFKGLKRNLLRTFLSLAGVSIGIFSVISILVSVDSLEIYLLKSLSKLGNNTLYVDRFDYSKMGRVNWAEIRRMKRPSYDEYLYLKKNLDPALYRAITYHLRIPALVIRHGRRDIRAGVIGVNADYAKINTLPFKEGRFFNEHEDEKGMPVIVLGHDVAEALFPDGKAPGKAVRLLGKKLKVIGVLQEEGGMVKVNPSNEKVFVPYGFLRKIIPQDSRMLFTNIMILPSAKAVKNKLAEQIEFKLRQYRKLKPGEKSTFHVNDISFLVTRIGKSTRILSLAGWILGGFSLLVGAFGIANIMFVSVKERTNEIGIQKALGANRNFILSEFLTESVLLALIGGIAGLMFLSFFVKFGNLFLSGKDFHIYLSAKNMILGITISIMIGLLAGLWPAWKAAEMNPIDAIRAKT